MTTEEILKKHNACQTAIEWAGNRSVRRAWRECPRADWLLWIAAEVGVDRKLLVRAACACARTALKYVPKGEDRPRLAIETAEQWCDGKTTISKVRQAANAAYAAAAAAASAYAYAYAYAYAASAAGYAAASAYAVTYAATYAAADAAAYAYAYAADAATYAAADAAAYAAADVAANVASYAVTLRKMATIVRRIISVDDVLMAIALEEKE